MGCAILMVFIGTLNNDLNILIKSLLLRLLGRAQNVSIISNQIT